MTKKPLKNKSHRMRSQTKKLGLSSKNPIKKKPIKKKSLKKKPNKKKKTPKKTKKGVGFFNRFRKKINPEYKLRTIVFMYDEKSQINAYYVKQDSPLEESHALKKFRFNVNQLEINKDRIVIKEAYELGRKEPLTKLGSEISFSINKYSTIPLGNGKFSLKFWGENDTIHQDIIAFFEPKKKKFNETLKKVRNEKPSSQPIAQTSAQPTLTSGRKFSVSREQNSNNNSSRTNILSEL